jgi:hypothetical protein
LTTPNFSAGGPPVHPRRHQETHPPRRHPHLRLRLLPRPRLTPARGHPVHLRADAQEISRRYLRTQSPDDVRPDDDRLRRQTRRIRTDRIKEGR